MTTQCTVCLLLYRETILAGCEYIVRCALKQTLVSYLFFDKLKWKWKVKVTYGKVWWPILGICALHLTHPKCTNTHSSEHTPWTHTRSSGQPFMLRPQGSSWGFGVLLKGTSVMVLKVERALYIHSPTDNPCWTWDSNSQPLDYESDSLTIRPQLPQSRGLKRQECVWQKYGVFHGS